MAKNNSYCVNGLRLTVITKVGGENMSIGIKVKIRLDYRGYQKPSKFFFGGKNINEVAEEMRDQQVAMLRNVPLQGISIEEVDMSGDVYAVYDEFIGADVSFAPVILTITADSLEDVIRFIAREEFKKIEIIQPESMTLSKNDIERVLFRVSEELRGYRLTLDRKYNSR